MKRKLVLLLLVTMSLSALSGCKTTEQKAKAQALKEIKAEYGNELTEEQAEMLADLYAEEAVYQEQKATQKKEEEKKILKMIDYSASPEWANYSYKDRTIQVDDMVLTIGCKVSDILDALDKSENEYSIDAADSQLTPFNSSTDVTVYKNGIEWFHFSATNIIAPDESIPLSECIAVNIHPALDTYQYCGAIGLMPSDVSKMDYSEIKEYLNDYFDTNEYSITENSTSVGNTSAIVLEARANGGLIPYSNTEWAGVQVTSGDLAAVYIDSETGKGMYAIRKIGGAYKWEKSQGNMIDSVDQLVDDEYNILIEEAREECIKDKNLNTVFNGENVVEMLYTGTTGYAEDTSGSMENGNGGLVFVYYYILENGNEGYMSANISNLSRNPVTNEISHDTIWTHSYDTQEEATAGLSY